MIFLIGTGATANEVAGFIQSENSSSLVYFIDHCCPAQNLQDGKHIISEHDFINKFCDVQKLFLTVADPKIKERIQLKYINKLHKIKDPLFASYQDKTCRNYGVAGIGSLLFPMSFIGKNARIDEYVLLNTAAYVGHDCVIGSYSTISPKASIGGNCVIGKNVFIGLNATINPRVKIADNTVIGSGATVVRDINEGGITWVGTPARPIKDR